MFTSLCANHERQKSVKFDPKFLVSDFEMRSVITELRFEKKNGEIENRPVNVSQKYVTHHKLAAFETKLTVDTVDNYNSAFQYRKGEPNKCRLIHKALSKPQG